MRRYEIDEAAAIEGWVEIPDEWLSGDYDTYSRASLEADANEHSPLICRLAGVLALVSKGRVNCEVDSVKLVDGGFDLADIKAEATAFLTQAVGLSLELTQIIPFGLSEPSESGTKAKAKG